MSERLAINENPSMKRLPLLETIKSIVPSLCSEISLDWPLIGETLTKSYPRLKPRPYRRPDF
jgi:hypothetical protein